MNAVAYAPRPGLPWVLDGYCGPGGAGMGYWRAGLNVLGVDKHPQPSYPFPMVRADMLDVLEHWDLSPFALLHASPPCQLFSEGAPGRKRDDHEDLLTPTRELLKASGRPYVIENVATAPMPAGLMLCGATFDLPCIRHRLFETCPDLGLVASLCHQRSYKRGVAHKGRYSYGHGRWRPAWAEHVLPVVWPWMELEESGQAIPPPYTEYLAGLLLSAIKAGEAA